MGSKSYEKSRKSENFGTFWQGQKDSNPRHTVLEWMQNAQIPWSTRVLSVFGLESFGTFLRRNPLVCKGFRHFCR